MCDLNLQDMSGTHAAVKQGISVHRHAEAVHFNMYETCNNTDHPNRIV